MATTYNTLSLESKETRKPRSLAAYVAVGLLVVALAGAGSYVAINNTNSVIDGAFDDFKGDVVSCMARAGANVKAVEAKLPRYDPDYSSKANGDRDFYNACYYSYSCCTEVSLQCLASEGYGQKCRTCLQNNGPKMVLPLCTDFLKTYGKGAKNGEAGQQWGRADILADKGFPVTNKMKMKQAFQKKVRAGDTSCWKRVGPSDRRMGKFVENCWDAISWCNLLCPRDDDDTVDEKMCKECVNLGFQANAPKRFTQGHTFQKLYKKSALATEVIRSASNKQK